MENTVQRARAELRVLEQERSKLEKQRKIQFKEFETSKNEARRLFEVCRKKNGIFFKSFFKSFRK